MRRILEMAPPRLELYAFATLRRDIEYQGMTFREGVVGQIVDVHGDGAAYEVEFAAPFAVITLHEADLL